MHYPLSGLDPLTWDSPDVAALVSVTDFVFEFEACDSGFDDVFLTSSDFSCMAVDPGDTEPMLSVEMAVYVAVHHEKHGIEGEPIYSWPDNQT